MKSINGYLKKLNNFQQAHHFSGFAFAVIKKYGDDSAGQKAALLTYYSFLALFPLLLLLTTVTDLLIGHNTHIRAQVINGLTNYFPLLGSQLASHVHKLKASGLALIVGIVFTLYGTRGIADSFTKSVRRIWLIPKSEQDGFPKNIFRSLCLIIVGGVGFILVSIISGYASAAGHGYIFRIISILINIFLLFWLFRFLISFSLPKRIPNKDTRMGAAVAAIGLIVLQSLGGYIIAHQLKRLDALYSYFAVTLGLLFWIYLQTQVLYYAVEIAVVSSQKLYPRSLDNNNPSKIDKKLAAFYDK